MFSISSWIKTPVSNCYIAFLPHTQCFIPAVPMSAFPVVFHTPSSNRSLPCVLFSTFHSRRSTGMTMPIPTAFLLQVLCQEFSCCQKEMQGFSPRTTEDSESGIMRNIIIYFLQKGIVVNKLRSRAGCLALYRGVLEENAGSLYVYCNVVQIG